MLVLNYYDRATGELRTEAIFMEAGLRFLYENPLGIWLFDRWLNAAWICWLCAQWQSLPRSRRRIQPFVTQYDIDLTECATPIEEFPHFNAFFARALRPGARSFVADRDRCLSPADGKVWVLPQLSPAMRLPIKGIGCSLDALLASADLAANYNHGAIAIIRLTPADYHRFHFGIAGIAAPSQVIRGRYHSVHPIALEQVPEAFCRNQRMITAIDSPQLGRVLMIEVGAFCIGTIRQTYAPGPIQPGDEKGYFQFGGSTIVLLFLSDRIRFDPDLVRYSAGGWETQIQAGNILGQAITAAGT
jgi:phosphatidylserine decarboxylase